MKTESINATTRQLYFEKIDRLDQQLNRAIEHGKLECATFHETLDQMLGKPRAEGREQATESSLKTEAAQLTGRVMKIARKMRGQGKKAKSS